MKKRLAVLLLILSLGFPVLSFAEEAVKSVRPSNDSEKLDKILDELETIKAELQIIKVRASLR